MNRPPPIRRLLDLDLLACLSASNLVFVQTWTLLDVRPAGGELYYYSLPTPSHLGALWLVMLLLGVALRLLVAGCRTGRPWIAVPSRLALLAAALVVFNILRHYLQATVDVDLFGPLRFKATAGFEWMAVAALGVTLAMLVRRESQTSRNANFNEVEKIFAVGDDASVEKLSQISWESLAEGSHIT